MKKFFCFAALIAASLVIVDGANAAQWRVVRSRSVCRGGVCEYRLAPTVAQTVAPCAAVEAVETVEPCAPVESAEPVEACGPVAQTCEAETSTARTVVRERRVVRRQTCVNGNCYLRRFNLFK